MDRTDERRAPGVARVPVTTLVEICGNDPGVPAFEAESLDMSGRGMHCRTGYVPEPGNSLVCRFEHDGSEVVVEGEVAWRRQRDEGGEFGIRFTALDAKGVDTLRRLCDIEAEVVERPPAPESDKERERTETGTRVRLHIDGLGTPMKARVRDGSSRKIRVGSNLEFLKVGRHLEIEDLDQGVRTGASIDSVDVVVDPQTQVPQLVVALRYDGAIDVTPEPSVVSAEPPEDDASELEAGSGVEAGSTEDEDSDAESEAAVLRNRLGNVATHVGDAMKHAGDRLAGLSRHAGAGMGRLMKDAGARVVAFRRQQRERPVKRTTAPPPSGALSTNPERLRGPKADRAASKPVKGAKVAKAPVTKRQRLVMAAAAFGVVATVGAAFALGGSPDEREDSASAAEHAAAAAPEVSVAVRAVAPPAKPAAQKPASDPDGVTANVPLFGPTPMATLEPAPLDPPSTEERETIEKAAAAASVEDESWDDKADAPKRAKPEDVKPWGRGRLHLPTIHRLRLDANGAALQGSMHPTGFTVLVPGRKVMESGKGIARRDKRIASVSTSNVASGAQITFKFRDGVPPYRARLRHDFVEFLVSAPDPSKAR